MEQARKLVESDEVFYFAPLGTASDAAIQKLHEHHEGAAIVRHNRRVALGDPEHFPWTIGWQPNYRAEARIYATSSCGITRTPDRRAVPNDDFGKDYVLGLKTCCATDTTAMRRRNSLHDRACRRSIPRCERSKPRTRHLRQYRHAEIRVASDQEGRRTGLASDPHHDQRVRFGSARCYEPAGFYDSAGILSAGYQNGRHRPAMEKLSRDAEISRLHGQVLSGSRQVGERTTDGIQYVDRVDRGAEAVART